jgi:hypothetical protein
LEKISAGNLSTDGSFFKSNSDRILERDKSNGFEETFQAVPIYRSITTKYKNSFMEKPALCMWNFQNNKNALVGNISGSE